jgi:hypothetical protein
MLTAYRAMVRSNCQMSWQFQFVPILSDTTFTQCGTAEAADPIRAVNVQSHWVSQRQLPNVTFPSHTGTIQSEVNVPKMVTEYAAAS